MNALSTFHIWVSTEGGAGSAAVFGGATTALGLQNQKGIKDVHMEKEVVNADGGLRAEEQSSQVWIW
jgi:hypothetical protein